MSEELFNNAKQQLMHLEVPAGLETLNQFAAGYQRFAILEAALDLGIFAFLAEHGPCDRETIAQGCGILGMLLRPLLACLVDMELIRRENEHYSNSSLAEHFLLAGSPLYQGDWLRNIRHHSHWSDLTTALQRTEPKQARTSGGDGPGAAFIDALGQRAVRGELQAVTRQISTWEGFAGAKKMLDIGGGHGLYAIALCQENPNLRATILDRPNVLPVTARNIKCFGMQDRCSLMEGDICAGNFGQGYDIVLISHLLYKFRKNLEPIFRQVKACLKTGGLLVTNHWFCAQGCVPEKDSVTELGKSLQSFGHPLCREEEFSRLLAENGMQPLAMQIVPTHFGPSRLIMAVRDGQACAAQAVQGCSCCC